MDQPGRWAGGFRAWDEHGVYLATARGIAPGRLLRVPADALRELTHGLAAMAGHLIAGLYGTARSIEATARQRGALITLGTLAAGLAHEINNPAAAAVARGRRADLGGRALLSSLGTMAGARMTPEQFSTPGPAASAGRSRRPPCRTPSRWPTERRSSPTGSRSRGRAAVGHRRRPRGRRRRPRLVRPGSGRSRARRARAVAALGGQHDPGDDAPHGGAGVDPSRLRARRGDQVLLADGPGITAERGRAQGSRAPC